MERYVIMGPGVVKLCLMQDFITPKPIRDCSVHQRQATENMVQHRHSAVVGTGRNSNA